MVRAQRESRVYSLWLPSRFVYLLWLSFAPFALGFRRVGVCYPLLSSLPLYVLWVIKHIGDTPALLSEEARVSSIPAQELLFAFIADSSRVCFIRPG
jgi:hypothetical protein